MTTINLGGYIYTTVNKNIKTVYEAVFGDTTVKKVTEHLEKLGVLKKDIKDINGKVSVNGNALQITTLTQKDGSS